MIALIFHNLFPIVIIFYLLGSVVSIYRRPEAGAAIFLVGFFLHTLFLLSRGLITGVWMPNLIIDSTYFLPWAMGAICLAMRLSSGHEHGKAVSRGLFMAVVVFSLPALFLHREIMPPGPRHETFFVPLYYGIDILAQAFFLLGAWLAVAHLKGKDPRRFFTSFLIAGFVFYSISQVVGAYWAYLGWALPMHWSTKHLQSASIWCYYAAVLHGRYLPAWNSRQEARFAIAGAALLLVFIYSAQAKAFRIPGMEG